MLYLGNMIRWWGHGVILWKRLRDIEDNRAYDTQIYQEQLSAYKVGKAWRIEKRFGAFLDTCRTAPRLKKLQKPGIPGRSSGLLRKLIERGAGLWPSPIPNRRRQILERRVIAIRKFQLNLPCPKCGPRFCFRDLVPSRNISKYTGFLKRKKVTLWLSVFTFFSWSRQEDSNPNMLITIQLLTNWLCRHQKNYNS